MLLKSIGAVLILILIIGLAYILLVSALGLLLKILNK